jgi:membrane protein insertase Oxa1/YidC/SpoIIIJ
MTNKIIMIIFCITIGITFILLAIYSIIDYSHKRTLRIVEIMLYIMEIILIIFVIILTIGLLICS